MYRDIYNDYLFAKICTSVQMALEDLKLSDEAISVKKKVEGLRT